MLGWHISVYRQEGGGDEPAKWDTPPGERLAVWQANLSGLDWLEALTHKNEAIRLGGNGYPTRYTLQTRAVMPVLENGPPDANDSWVFGVHDVLTDKWVGRTAIHRGVVKRCAPDEWLLVEIWDES